MKNFYNEKQSIVTDAIDGLIAANGGRLQRFDHSSHARVVVRADWDKSKVAIISGGGSGHEPAHAGLVGEGLLTAAVCGEVYASPSVDAVLSAIMQVTGPSGCLLIIMNYTGDRLNFGLAAEKAKALGHKVEMVIVGDDIAIDDAKQPRGIAGTIFAHKIAGYHSEQGANLDTVLKSVNNINPHIKTIGVARDTCTIPGSSKQERIEDDQVEVGLGIHGEAGVAVETFSNCVQLMADLSGRLLSKIDKKKRHVLLFNNLGGLNGLECAVLFKELMLTELVNTVDFIMGPAVIMSALDMPGFSITMVPIEQANARALMSSINLDVWPTLVPVKDMQTVSPPEIMSSPNYAPSNNPEVRKMLETIIETCIASEDDLNELDAKVGDGDTGTTFAGAARTVKSKMDQLPLADGAELFETLSDIKSKLMGGSSGVLFAIMFANASIEFGKTTSWPKALSAGLDAMQKYGGAKQGDRTMIDALRPAIDTLVKGGSVTEAGIEARKGANSTAEMLSANAGRSSYLEARSLKGHSDPGAEGIARIFESIAKFQV